jgi:hypothetical protein
LLAALTSPEVVGMVPRVIACLGSTGAHAEGEDSEAICAVLARLHERHPEAYKQAVKSCGAGDEAVKDLLARAVGGPAGEVAAMQVDVDLDDLGMALVHADTKVGLFFSWGLCVERTAAS